MKKIILLTGIIVILISQIVFGSVEREVLELKTNCVSEDILIKIRGDKNISNTYKILNCNFWKKDRWEYYKCKCSGQDIINVDIESSNGIFYDFIVEYYIAPLEEVTDKPDGQFQPSPIELRNLEKKRTEFFNDIFVESLIDGVNETKKNKFLPEINITDASYVIGIVGTLAIIVLIIVMFWFKGVIKEDDIPNIDKQKDKGRPPLGFKELSKEESDNYIDKYL